MPVDNKKLIQHPRSDSCIKHGLFEKSRVVIIINIRMECANRNIPEGKKAFQVAQLIIIVNRSLFLEHPVRRVVLLSKSFTE